MSRVSKRQCLGLILFVLLTIVFLPAVEAKTPVKAPTKTPAAKPKNPSSLRPMSGAQMDTYVPMSPPANSRLLEGSLEHSETLSSENSRFAAGTKFDSNELSKLAKDNRWYWIPSWFAGAYQTHDLVRIYRYDFQTGKTDISRVTGVHKRNEKWGWQMDRNGQVWHCDSTPYSITIDRDNLKEVQLVKTCEPVKITQDTAVLRFVSTLITIDKTTDKIDEVRQFELLQTYKPVSGNRVELRVSAKVFDQNGTAVSLDKNVQYLYKTSGYEPEDFHDDKDMRVLFKEFLLSHNRPDLVPESGSGF